MEDSCTSAGIILVNPIDEPETEIQDAVWRLAGVRSLSPGAMRAVGAYPASKNHKVHWPMRNAHGHRVGVRHRKASGEKFVLQGGRQEKSLTLKGGRGGWIGQWPLRPGPILLIESEIDAASALTFGWSGQVMATPGANPSGDCLGWIGELAQGREVIMVPHGDAGGATWTERLGAQLVEARASVTVVPSVLGMDLHDRMLAGEQLPDVLAAAKPIVLPQKPPREQKSKAPGSGSGSSQSRPSTTPHELAACQQELDRILLIGWPKGQTQRLFFGDAHQNAGGVWPLACKQMGALEARSAFLAVAAIGVDAETAARRAYDIGRLVDAKETASVAAASTPDAEPVHTHCGEFEIEPMLAALKHLLLADRKTIVIGKDKETGQDKFAGAAMLRNVIRTARWILEEIADRGGEAELSARYMAAKDGGCNWLHCLETCQTHRRILLDVADLFTLKPHYPSGRFCSSGRKGINDQGKLGYSGEGRETFIWTLNKDQAQSLLDGTAQLHASRPKGSYHKNRNDSMGHTLSGQSTDQAVQGTG